MNAILLTSPHPVFKLQPLTLCVLGQHSNYYTHSGFCSYTFCILFNIFKSNCW